MAVDATPSSGPEDVGLPRSESATNLDLLRVDLPGKSVAEGLDKFEEQSEARQQDIINTFIDLECPIGAYEAVKLVLMAPVVLAKGVLLSLVLVYAWAVLRVLLLGHTSQTPLHRARRALVEAWVKFWARLLLFVGGFYRIRVTGRENLRAAQEARAVIVFNHVSYVDAAALAALFAPCAVAKSGVARLPLVGTFAVALQTIFVERRGTRDRANRFTLQADPIAAIRERAADRRYPLVMMAPEATTKPRPCLLRFRRGAFSAGAPVVPVLLRYRFAHFNPGWGRVSPGLHLYRLMAQLYNTLDVEVLPLCTPTEAQRRDPQAFAGAVRAVMAGALRVPMVDVGLSEDRELNRLGVMPNLRGTAVARRKTKAD